LNIRTTRFRRSAAVTVTAVAPVGARKTNGRLALVAAAIAAAAAITVPAGPAAASVCTTQYCGGVVTNNSSGLIRVSNMWCWSNISTWYGSTLPCATSWNAYAYNSFFLLGHPDTTANYYYYYDTDAFRVDAGCQVHVYDGFEDLVFSDRGNATPMWVKITNNQKFTVTSINC
jgi:hypothetical protein